MWAFLLGAALLSGAGTYSAGKYREQELIAQSRMSVGNAQIAEEDAQAVIKKSVFEQTRQAEEGALITGELKARMSASGIRTDVGTPLLIEEEQQAELELENMLIGYEGQLLAKRYRSQAELDYMQSGIYKRKAKSAKTAGTIGAGAALLQGFGTVGYYEGW